MRKLFILAAVAAVSAACHNRNEDQVGAAPDQGRTDTTAVTHVLDSTRTGPPGEAGRPGNATITADSVGLDSTRAQPGAADTTAAGQNNSPTSVPQDTLGPRNPGAGAIDSTSVRSDTSGVRSENGAAPSDTSAMQHDTTMQHDATMQHDTTMSDTTSNR
jgi:hypothetical protein